MARSPLLILGSAACLWRDLDRAAALGLAGTTVMAVNRAGEAYRERIDHWVSLHPEMMHRFMARRAGNRDCTSWSYLRPPHWSETKVVPERWRGGSGLYAVQIGLEELGFDRILLAGMPIDRQPYCYGDGSAEGLVRRRWTGERGLARYRAAWKAASFFFGGRVRSFSGWSRDLLGPPDHTWLAADRALAVSVEAPKQL